jgi:hypothetical protein
LSDTLAALSPVGTLPDEVLLEIFKFYQDDSIYCCWYSWPTLAQVCQRWRHVVAASPRYLDLQIESLTLRSASGLMGGWPTLPIFIRHIGDTGTEGVDHVTAALEHNNRVVRISLSEVPGWQLEIFVALMKKPFPELTGLDIAFTSRYHFRYFKPPPPVFPDSFLGGSAPSLQSLRLDGVPFPGLPKLLLSSHGLVDIDLYDIPSSGYIPPEEMATCLSPMKHLKSLKLKFNNNDNSPSLTAEQHPPSLTRIVLPALTSLSIHCTSEFLEGFVSRLDAPSLEEMDTELPRYDVPVSNITELPRFISRIEMFETFDKADIHIRDPKNGGIELIFSEQESSVAGAELTSLTLTFTQSRGQIRLFDHDSSQSTPAVCSFLPPLSRFKYLMLHEHRSQGSIDVYQAQAFDRDTPTREILNSFTAVTNIFISELMAPGVSLIMEGLSEERAVVMLPALRNIFVEGLQRQEKATRGAIREFVAAKGLAGHPVTLHRWEP